MSHLNGDEGFKQRHRRVHVCAYACRHTHIHTKSFLEIFKILSQVEEIFVVRPFGWIWPYTLVVIKDIYIEKTENSIFVFLRNKVFLIFHSEDVLRSQNKPLVCTDKLAGFSSERTALSIIPISNDLRGPELSVLSYIHNRDQDNPFKIFLTTIAIIHFITIDKHVESIYYMQDTVLNSFWIAFTLLTKVSTHNYKVSRTGIIYIWQMRKKWQKNHIPFFFQFQ